MNEKGKLLKWSNLEKKKKRTLFFILDWPEFHYVSQPGLRLAAILLLSQKFGSFLHVCMHVHRYVAAFVYEGTYVHVCPCTQRREENLGYCFPAPPFFFSLKTESLIVLVNAK